MIAGLAPTATRFAAKGLGMGAQLVTLVLITQALGADGFGRYALLLSIASIAAQLADFGTGRCQFRRAHRGSPVTMLAMGSLAFRLVTSLLLLPPLLFYAAHIGLPTGALALGFAANLLFQFANLNRHLLLLDGRVTAAILVESAPALLFCVAIALCLTGGMPLGVTGALLLYLLATAASFAASMAASGTAAGWARAATLLLRTRWRRTLSGVAALARRATPIGLDIFLAAATLQAPILIASVVGDGAAMPQVALVQRILGLEVAVLSVSITARLKAYHDRGASGMLDLRPALASAMLVFGCNMAGLFLLAPLATLVSADFTLVALALALQPHLLLIAAVAGCTTAYLHGSMAALGGNWLWQRCLSGSIGLAVTIASAVLLSVNGAKPLSAVLLAALLGQGAAFGVLVAAVSRHGGRLRLPQLRMPLRSPATGAGR